MGYNKGEFFISGDSRKRKIYILIVIIAVLAIVSLYSFMLHVKSNKEKVIRYDEESTLDYKVYLKDNEFFRDKYLEKDKQYIASLIDYVDATFNYDLTLTNSNNDYGYTYKIEAEVNVVNPENNNSLYKSSEMLVPEKSGKGHGHSTTSISERIKIDYNKYNDLISKFLETYDLTHLDSNLSINMYVDFDGGCENENLENQKSVIKLVIPLTRKTVAIDMSSDVTSNTGGTIKCNIESNYVYLIISLVTLGAVIRLIVELIKYIEDSKSPIEVYNSKFKKIMNNYGSFIQKISSDYDMSKSQILKVDSFDDMLEIRDTLQAPILMLENEDQSGVFFIIPTGYNVLYTYALRIDDIKVDMINDVLEEPKKAVIPKEYNDEYITRQLTMIKNNPIENENTIKGTQESNEDLYSQIEKTQEFRLNLRDEDISELFKEIENTDVADVKKKKKKKTTKKVETTEVKEEEKPVIKKVTKVIDEEEKPVVNKVTVKKEEEKVVPKKVTKVQDGDKPKAKRTTKKAETTEVKEEEKVTTKRKLRKPRTSSKTKKSTKKKTK